MIFIAGRGADNEESCLSEPPPEWMAGARFESASSESPHYATSQYSN